MWLGGLASQRLIHFHKQRAAVEVCMLRAKIWTLALSDGLVCSQNRVGHAVLAIVVSTSKQQEPRLDFNVVQGQQTDALCTSTVGCKGRLLVPRSHCFEAVNRARVCVFLPTLVLLHGLCLQDLSHFGWA